MKFRGISEVSFVPGNVVERAISLAVTAHYGQKRKNGEPYILHPLRVMLAFNSWPGVEGNVLRATGVLHDVCEDCGISVETIAGLCGRKVADAVNAMTRRDDGPYSDYIVRLATNEIARMVKIADLEDNLRDIDTLPDPEEAKSLRRRYEWALSVLK